MYGLAIPKQELEVDLVKVDTIFVNLLTTPVTYEGRVFP